MPQNPIYTNSTIKIYAKIKDENGNEFFVLNQNNFLHVETENNMELNMCLINWARNTHNYELIHERYGCFSPYQ